MKPKVCVNCIKLSNSMSLQQKRQTCYNCRLIYKYDILTYTSELEAKVAELENQIMVSELLKDLHKDIEKVDPFGDKRYKGKGFKWSKELLSSIGYLYLSTGSTVEVSKILGMSQKTVWRILARDYKRVSTIEFIDSVLGDIKITKTPADLFEG